MKLHPRLSVVADAEAELARFWSNLVTKYDLTYGEMFKLLSERIQRLAMYAIRSERHPNDPDKGGDEA